MILLARGNELEVGEVREQLAEVGACERASPFTRRLCEPGAEPRVHPIHDERCDRDAAFGQPVGEVRRLLDGVTAG